MLGATVFTKARRGSHERHDNETHHINKYPRSNRTESIEIMEKDYTKHHENMRIVEDQKH